MHLDVGTWFLSRREEADDGEPAVKESSFSHPAECKQTPQKILYSLCQGPMEVTVSVKSQRRSGKGKAKYFFRESQSNSVDSMCMYT